VLPDTADPRTRALIDRLTALRATTRQAILKTRLAIEASDKLLRASHALLADRLDRPDPPDDPDPIPLIRFGTG
jgi:hypothetical protein